MRKREYKPLRRRLKALETVKIMLSNLTFASQVAIVSSQIMPTRFEKGGVLNNNANDFFDVSDISEERNSKRKLICEMVANQAKQTSKQLKHLSKINSINA